MKKKEVIKHSSAIQVSNEVNLLQRKAWNVLLANAFDDLRKKEVFYINIDELCNALQYGSHNDDHIKQLLRDLIDIKIEWNVLGKDRGGGWGVASLLSEVEIINGVISYAYSPTIRKKFYNPSVYAKINLSLQNRFKSKHSLALYELFLDYFNMEQSVGQTPMISLEDFRKLMGLKEHEYTQFKFLNAFVIKKAIKEINEKSNLQVRLECIKRGRRIAGLKFYISKNAKNTVDLYEIKPKVFPEQKAIPIPEFQVYNQELFVTLTDEFGISDNKAAEILMNKDEFFIKENLDVIRKKIEEGKVDSTIAGMTIDALKKDYRSKKPKHEVEKEKKIAEQKRVEEEKKLIEKLREEFDKHYREKADEIIEGFSKDYLNIQLKGFEVQEIKNSNDIIKRFFKESGIESGAIRPFFRAYVASQFLDDQDRDFIIWAKKKKYKIEQRADGKYYFVKTVKKKK